MHLSPETLLQKLTIDQKLAQLVAIGSSSDFLKNGKFDREAAKNKCPHGLFGLTAPIELTLEETYEWICDMRDFFATFES